MPPVPTFEEDQELNSEDEKILHFIQRTSQQMVARTVATFLSQPFHVISCRMMAQFVGGELKYTSVRDYDCFIIIMMIITNTII